MGRAAIVLGVALCGCSSVFRAPGMLGRQIDPETRVAAPEARVATSERALTAAELQALIRERVDELASALEPVCGRDCRSVMARAEPELESLAALQVSRSRSEAALLYRPNDFQALFAYNEALAMWGLAHEMGHYVDIAIAGSEVDDRWRLEMSAYAVAGCAFVTLGLRFELVHAALSAAVAPDESIDSRLDLVCGSDREHPAMRWEIEAFDTGVRLCQSRVVPLERLETEVAELTGDAKRAAEKARAWFPETADPCRLRQWGDLPHRKAYGE